MSSQEVEEQIPEDNDTAEMSADDIDGNFVPRRRANIASVELDGETVLLLEGTTRTHLLNQTATIVWDCLDGQVTLAELGDELADAFGGDPKVIRDDVINLVRGVGRAGLLEGVAEEAPVRPGYQPPEGLPLGAELASFGAPDLDGNTHALEELRGRKVLLVNWSPGCGFCKRIAPDLAELQPELRAQGVELVLLTFGEVEENREVLLEAGLECTVFLHDGSVDVFGAVGTPCAYLVDEEGKVASELAVGALDVPVLAQSAAGKGNPES